MNKKTKSWQKTFFPIIILTLIVFTSELLVLSQNETPLKEDLKRIEELVLTSHILSSEEYQLLNTLLKNLPKKTKDLETLKKVSLEVTNKIVRDRSNLQFILTDLDKLAKNKYTSEIGKINNNEFQTCWDKFRKLVSAMEKNRPRINKPNKPLNYKDYLKIMKKNSVFITGETKLTSIPEVWDAIQKKIQNPYQLWDKRYQELLKKIKGLEEENLQQIFNNDELKFLKIFGRVKIYYLKLAGIPISSEEIFEEKIN